MTVFKRKGTDGNDKEKIKKIQAHQPSQKGKSKLH